MLDRENIEDKGKMRLWRGFGAHTWLQMRKANVCTSENKVAVYKKREKRKKGVYIPHLQSERPSRRHCTKISLRSYNRRLMTATMCAAGEK